MGKITDIYKCHDSSGKVCKVVFTIDSSKSNGLLHFTHEACVGYDLRTGKWSGDEINADGWVTLNGNELNDIVEEYELEERVKESVKNGD